MVIFGTALIFQEQPAKGSSLIDYMPLFFGIKIRLLPFDSTTIHDQLTSGLEALIKMAQDGTSHARPRLAFLLGDLSSLKPNGNFR